MQNFLALQSFEQLKSVLERSRQETDQELKEIQENQIIMFFNQTESMQKQFKDLLLKKVETVSQLLNLAIVAIKNVEELKNDKEELEATRKQLYQSNQELKDNLSQICQLNRKFEEKIQELVICVQRQRQKISKSQENQQMLLMQQSQMRRQFQQRMTQLNYNQQKDFNQECPENMLDNQGKVLGNSIMEIKNELAELKQSTNKFRKKVETQSKRLSKQVVRNSRSLDWQADLFSSIPANLLKQRAIFPHTNVRMMKTSSNPFQSVELKKCQSDEQIIQAPSKLSNSNGHKIQQLSESCLNQSSCKEFNKLSDLINNQSMKDIENLETDNNKYALQNTAIQSNFKQTPKHSVFKRKCSPSEISEIGRSAPFRRQRNQFSDHIFQILSENEKTCLCKTASKNIKSFHNFMFNHIVRDRIEPRRTINKIKKQIQLQRKTEKVKKIQYLKKKAK